MNLKSIFNRGQLHCLLGISLLATLTGCPATAPVVITAPAAAPAPQVQPVVVAQPTVVVQPEVVAGGLIYYPDYEVYYDPNAHIYWHNDGSHWNRGPTPFGVSINVLQGSISAQMNFRDSPENHHSEVAQQYPHGWKPNNANGPGRDRRGN
jgi:hypothetical protein